MKRKFLCVAVLAAAVSSANAAVFCNWYDDAGDAQNLTWHVGQTLPTNPRSPATDQLGASCFVYGQELQFVQQNFNGLHNRKNNGGSVTYTGDDALFIINNL